MEKTAKQHFKAMYQAVRLGRLPCEVVVAALDAEKDFGRLFSIKIAVAAYAACRESFLLDLQERLVCFKCDREYYRENLPF